MITASKIEVAMRCPGAFTLPWLNESNDYNEAGSERHAEDEQAIGRGEIPEILARTWPGYTWRAEVMFVFNVATGEAREIGQGSNRAYGNLGPFDVAGTADAIGRNGNRLVVVDKKSFGSVTRAADNPQIRFLGLAAARAYGLDTIEIAINHLIRGIDQADLDVMDLDIIHHELRETLISVAKAQNDARNGRPVQFNVGPQCRWCNAFHACPKQKSLIVQVETPMGFPLADDTEAADAYDLLQRIRVLTKRLTAAIYARAGERPIPLNSGLMLGFNTSEGNEKLDGDVVYEVVKELHGQGIADAAVIRSATKTRLAESLALVGGKLAPLEREVLGEVRKRGGSKREQKTTIQEYEPGQLQIVKEADCG